MKLDSIQDSTRYVVSEVHKGSIMPGNRAEMWRNIYLDEGAKVYGGVWGGELTISGGEIFVDQSIYIRGSVLIKDNKSNKEIEFGSVVASPDSLLIEKNAPRTRFNSDIFAGQLNLQNSIVYGNVYASNAKIENSIILGGVYCKKNLEIKNSIIFIFKTKTVDIKENVYLLAPYSISEQKIDVNYPIKALTFYNIFDDENTNNGFVSLDENDVFQVKYNESNVGNEQIENFPSKVYILSIAERILNSTKIITQFRKNKELIEFLTYGNNLVDDYKQQFKDFKKNEIEKSLWKIIKQGIKQEPLNGESEFNELVDKFKKENDISYFNKIHHNKSKKQKNTNTPAIEKSADQLEKNVNNGNQKYVKCKICGAVFHDDNLKFCTECGNKLDNE